MQPAGARAVLQDVNASRAVLLALTIGSVVLAWVARRPEHAESHRTAAPHPLERWLPHSAEAALIADDGGLGPLFSDLLLGGPAPAPDVRDRIAAFARANHVAIELDVADDELSSIRVAVEFGGCCGYEGADMLALHLGRPRTDTCCGCGERTWANEWAVTHDDTHLRARVIVNRVELTWQPMLTMGEVLDRAEHLLGTPVTTLAARRGERLIERAPGTEFTLALPFPFQTDGSSDTVRHGRQLGLRMAIEHGRVAQISFGVHGDNDELTAAFRRRWGRPRVTDEGRTWRTPTVEVTTAVDEVRELVLRTRS